jgi:hypothetical protein
MGWAPWHIIVWAIGYGLRPPGISLFEPYAMGWAPLAYHCLSHMLWVEPPWHIIVWAIGYGLSPLAYHCLSHRLWVEPWHIIVWAIGYGLSPLAYHCLSHRLWVEASWHIIVWAIGYGLSPLAYHCLSHRLWVEPPWHIIVWAICYGLSPPGKFWSIALHGWHHFLYCTEKSSSCSAGKLSAPAIYNRIMGLTTMRYMYRWWN